jgi:hypothetical protein
MRSILLIFILSEEFRTKLGTASEDVPGRARHKVSTPLLYQFGRGGPPIAYLNEQTGAQVLKVTVRFVRVTGPSEVMVEQREILRLRRTGKDETNKGKCHAVLSVCGGRGNPPRRFNVQPSNMALIEA